MVIWGVLVLDLATRVPFFLSSFRSSHYGERHLLLRLFDAVSSTQLYRKLNSYAFSTSLLWTPLIAIAVMCIGVIWYTVLAIKNPRTTSNWILLVIFIALSLFDLKIIGDIFRANFSG